MNEKRDRLKIICLGETELDLWHAMFDGRRTVRGKVNIELIEEANAAGRKLLQNGGVERKRFGQLPGYYAFANNNTAIIVAPIFLPVIEPTRLLPYPGPLDEYHSEYKKIVELYNTVSPDGKGQASKKLECLRKILSGSGQADHRQPDIVEMFGMVTNDERIVEYVNELLDEYEVESR